MNFSDFINGGKPSQRPNTRSLPMDNIASSESEDLDAIEVIINEKPKVKLVREFFRSQLAEMKSPEERMFNKK